jgi:tRNA(Ile)-lysidine synthase TilS/MesJ
MKKHEIYLKRVFKTIEKAKLVESGDKILVALSGGKDSACALYTLKKYSEEKDIDCEIVGFHINMGGSNSQEIEEVIKKQVNFVGVDLIKINFSDYGINLEELKKSKRPICSICGLAKRYLMNKIPREQGANKIATGHHLDDFLVFFFKNLLSQNFSWISKFRPKVKPTHEKMICKIRPLFRVTREENKKFCDYIGLPYIKAPCPFISRKDKIKILRREKWYETIDLLEKRHKNFKLQLSRAIEKISKKFEESEKLKACLKCGEPTSEDICGFCKIFN